MLTSQCVHTSPRASQGLHFITDNLPRQHEGTSDKLHVRPAGVNDHHSGGRRMNGADKPLGYLTLFESCVSTMKTGRSEQEVQETHACSSVDIWIGLKIDQVTVKLATHRITSQGQCCISAS